MPTYPYACTECNHQFEVVQSFSDDALTQCPECSGKLRKVWGSVGVVFKGSGFYRTDSRTGAEKKKASASSSTSTSSDSAKSESKSESKSEKKSSDSSSSTSTSSTSSSSASSAGAA